MTPRVRWLPALAFFSGCGGSEPPRLVVHEIRPVAQVVVFRERQGKAESIDGRFIRQEVTRALAGAKHMVFAKGAEPPSCRLRVEAMLEIDAETLESRALVAMRTERDEMPLSATVAVQGRLHADSDRSSLVRAIGEAAHALDEQAGLRAGSDRALFRALGSPDDDLKITAARLLGTRRVPGATAQIAKLLGHPRQQVRDAAVGALIELKDPHAVRALIESASSNDAEAQLRIVEALAAIGGEEATAYLELLASGSDEPDIRDAATRARERLARHR